MWKCKYFVRIRDVLKFLNEGRRTASFKIVPEPSSVQILFNNGVYAIIYREVKFYDPMEDT